MSALQGAFALNFLRGVLATVNPCGFVLLPTYLMFFLGTEGVRPGTQRASLRRALVVSAAVAAGFFAVFLAIGLLVHWGESWFLDQSEWFGLGVGVLLVGFGLSMLFQWKPAQLLNRLSNAVPKTALGRTDLRIVSMFLYGVSYAVASIGCTLGLFLPALTSAGHDGYASAVLTTALYGIGMGAALTALTVTLAFARTGLLRGMRRVMAHLDLVAGALMVITGVYLVWYWSSVLRHPVGDKGSAVRRVASWQERVETWLTDIGVWPIAVVLGGISVGAILFVVARGRAPRSAAEQ